jgi:hypothetical protein
VPFRVTKPAEGDASGGDEQKVLRSPPDAADVALTPGYAVSAGSAGVVRRAHDQVFLRIVGDLPSFIAWAWRGTGTRHIRVWRVPCTSVPIERSRTRRCHRCVTDAPLKVAKFRKPRKGSTQRVVNKTDKE